MFVIGTAGHVDHGKSTLIKALTGIDPDRLREEKERGMTIDLGFAWLQLPSGKEVSIVDVPGHERFVKNMLAGVGGIDLALLVVAADEGVMPQTREHLDIIDLLRIKNGVVAVTKKDLVEEDWLGLVLEEVGERLKATSLSGAPIVPVSAVTGEGLPQLLAALDDRLAVATPRPDLGKPRLSVDRAFTVAGFGTVVTGTLIDGSLKVGQEVEVLPKGLESRIRGLQTHKHKVDAARPGTRVAINLASLAVADIQRGDVVTSPGWLAPTRAFDARLRLLPGVPRPVAHNAEVSVHTGAAETEARLMLLEGSEVRPGQSTWAQLRLARPLAIAKGDFFVLRFPSATIGGGQVVDPHPRRHKRGQRAVLEALETMEKGTPEEIVLQALGKEPPVELTALLSRCNLPEPEARAALGRLVAQGQVFFTSKEDALGPKTSVISYQGWAELTARARDVLSSYHQSYPLRRGMAKEELKSRLGLPPRAFLESLARWVQEGEIAEDATLAWLSSHRVTFTPPQEKGIERLVAALSANPYSPPGPTELATLVEPQVLEALIEQGELVRVSESVVFLASAYKEMVDRIVAHLKQHGKITAAEVRDRFNTSRKYAIGLLEHLDEAKVTRRVGDERVLR